MKIGNGKILLMDDDEMVRTITTKILKKLGYEVVVAVDGEEAVELYLKELESGSSFDAVILDLTVPGGMGAEAAVEELLVFDPKTKAIVSSGYGGHTIMKNFGKHGFSASLVKPYNMQEVSDILFRVVKNHVN